MSELACAAFAAVTGSHLIDEPRSARYEAFRRSFDETAFRHELATRGIRWLGRSDAAFPPLLRAIHDPPPGLFLRGEGETSSISSTSVAVVGARACSSYGTAVATSFGRRLAESGVTVVSGLARGVDAAAHRGALEAGVTVAVLGCGIDRDYPRSHAGLAERIAERGLIVSEYPPGVEPAPWRFPASWRRKSAQVELTTGEALARTLCARPSFRVLVRKRGSSQPFGAYQSYQDGLRPP